MADEIRLHASITPVADETGTWWSVKIRSEDMRLEELCFTLGSGWIGARTLTWKCATRWGARWLARRRLAEYRNVLAHIRKAGFIVD